MYDTETDRLLDATRKHIHEALTSVSAIVLDTEKITIYIPEYREVLKETMMTLIDLRDKLST